MTKSLERAIESEIRNVRRNEVQPSQFNWIPLILVFLSLEVGGRSGTKIERIQIPADSHTKLTNTILSNYEIVSRILSQCQSLGFSLSVEKDSVYIDMHNVLPTHVYSDVAFQMTKFIQFELNR
jgi:hypothetical protein